jgi:hypothetical protein
LPVALTSVGAGPRPAPGPLCAPSAPPRKIKRPTSCHVPEAVVNFPRRWPPLLVLLSGCVGPQQALRPYQPATPPRALVFAVDGAGGYQNNAAVLTQTIAADGLPIAVQPFTWTHGQGRYLADQTDLCHAEEQGRRLAAEVVAVQQRCPGLPVSLLAHSAGSIVILEAAKSLPPDSLHRIVLIMPAVSAHYDLRPALRACRGSVEVFYSEHDRLQLLWGTGIVGTTDRRRDAAAGRVGFRPCPVPDCDAPLFTRLRQHPWSPVVAWTGNAGGHSDAYHPQFLRAYVLPLLLP